MQFDQATIDAIDAIQNAANILSDYADDDATVEPGERIRPADVLIAAADAIDNRAIERDQPNGERSIPRTVLMFNILTGNALTEREGWIFLALLKLVRAQGGEFRLDDYVDAAGYIGLAAETAATEASQYAG